MSENQYEPKFVPTANEKPEHEALRAAERLAEKEKQGAHRAQEQCRLQSVRHSLILTHRIICTMTGLAAAGCRDRAGRSKPPVPQPFPAARRGSSRRDRPAPPASPPRPPAAACTAASRRSRPTRPRAGAPTRRRPKPRSACRSIPGAQFLASYDAGRGQRFYLFGSAASFADPGDVLPDAAEAARRAGVRRARRPISSTSAGSARRRWRFRRA